LKTNQKSRVIWCFS